MSTIDLTYDKSEQRVLTFLEKIDSSFHPKISTRIDLTI